MQPTSPRRRSQKSTYTAQVAAANDDVEFASGKVAAMKEELKRLDGLKQQVQGGQVVEAGSDGPPNTTETMNSWVKLLKRLSKLE